MYTKTIQLPSFITSGTYTVRVQDSLNQVSTDTVAIVQPTLPSTYDLRYSYDVGTKMLQVDSSSDLSTISFEAQDNSTVLAGNSDGDGLQSGTPYGAGPLSGQGVFVKQWRFGRRSTGSGGFQPGQGIKLVIQGTSPTFTYYLNLPTASITNKVLIQRSAPTQDGPWGPDNENGPSIPVQVVNQLPSWITSLNYSYSGGLLTLKAAGSVDLMKFERSDGQSFTTSNPDNVTIQSNQYYGFGFVNNTKQWQVLLPQVSLKITAKLSSTNQTAEFVFTPATNAANVNLGSTPSQPVGIKYYQRVLVVGNSITRHPVIPAWANGTRGPWGMDASAANKDYYSLLGDKFREVNPSVQLRRFGDINGTDGVEGSYWESAYWNPASDALARIDLAAAFNPDLVIIRLLENVTDLSHNFPVAYKALIDRLKAQSPTAKVVVTGSVWESLTDTQVQGSQLVQQVATERSYPFVSFSGMANATDGFSNHPSDAGHINITNLIWDKVPISVTP